MSIWSGIKHAINSTLGTGQFKPLNEIIVGEKRFVSGKSVIGVLYENKTRKNFTPKIDGAVTVKVIAEPRGSFGSFRIRFYNSSGEYTQSQEFRITERTECYADFSIQPEETYYATVVDSVTSSVNYDSIYLCGQITDYNYFDIT